MIIFQNTVINSTLLNNFFTQFDGWKNLIVNDEGITEYPFNIAFNVFDETGPNLIPGIEKFANF